MSPSVLLCGVRVRQQGASREDVASAVCSLSVSSHPGVLISHSVPGVKTATLTLLRPSALSSDARTFVRGCSAHCSVRPLYVYKLCISLSIHPATSIYLSIVCVCAHAHVCMRAHMYVGMHARRCVLPSSGTTTCHRPTRMHECAPVCGDSMYTLYMLGMYITYHRLKKKLS